MAETTKSPETKATVPSETAPAATKGPEKKKSNTLVIILVVLIVIIGVCCGGTFLALRLMGNIFSSQNFQENIQNELENAIEEQFQKDGSDVDIDFNYNKEKTQALPQSFPSDVKTIIPSSWKDPYNVNRSSQNDQTQIYALYFVKGKSSSSLASEAENLVKSKGWTAETYENSETETTIITSTKQIGGVTYTVNMTFTPQGSDTDITLVVNY